MTGALPPLSDAAWQAELQYLSSPQGRLVNRSFTVGDFQQIFWLEFLHRLWGRLIGLVFAVPLARFWLRGQLPPALKRDWSCSCWAACRACSAGRWWRQASSIAPRSATTGLAAHLLLAVALYAYTVWLILELNEGARRDDPKTARKAGALIGLLLVVMTFGAFMAGLRAGWSHNTFPTMSGYWIPPGLFELSPWWINFFENGTTIQFVHRWLAKLLALGVLALLIRARRSETYAAAAMAVVQVGLGIATILTGVDLAFASLHQAGAVLLLTALIVVRHRATASRGGPLRAMLAR